MKHIALRSLSVRNNAKPYTTPGLGDRAHSLLMAYQCSKAFKSPVTLHLTDDKWSIAGGVPSDKKKKSWAELVELFPAGSVQVKPWETEGLSEKAWLQYLKDKGIVADIYYYKDTMSMHRDEDAVGIEVSQYLKQLPCLDPIDCSADLKLPNKFVTWQWDSTDKGRMPNDFKMMQIEQKYRSLGYEIIVVGGESKNELLRNSIKHIGYAMSKAELHVGADSGMMHLAQYYKPYSKIHVYKGGYISHHLVRAQNNGSVMI